MASSPAAIIKSFCSEIPSGKISVTTGLPSVIVPVLSSTTQSIICAVSSASPDLIKIPFSAPFPIPTIIATGVARPNEHGQAMTKTVIAQDKANSKSAPNNIQIIKVATAIAIITGTKTPAILSANFAIGALVALASSTNAMIFAKVVSSPIFVAFTLINPPLLIVAPITVSPAAFSTGILSPVIAASSTLVLPSKIIPSTGTRLPGFTKTMSSNMTASTGTSTSTPSRSTKAVLGTKSIIFLIDSEVFPLDLASKYLPSVINVKIIAADSKYKSS